MDKSTYGVPRFITAKKIESLKNFFLTILALLTTSWTNDSNQLVSENRQPYYELIKFCLSDYPDNTQVSIALIKDNDITYMGYKKIKDSLYVIDNKDSVFEIASITKIFTSCLFSDLVYHHVFSLDDSINGILPFPLKQSGLKGKQITFKTLLNHTAGLTWAPDNYIEIDPENPYADYSKEKFNDYLQHLIKPNSIPGDSFTYSNTGLALVGYLMEQKTGKTYEDMLQEKVFSKYHMNSTTTKRKNIKNHIVSGLNADGHIVPAGYLNAMIPAGGVLSNASDLAKFVKYNFTDDSILSFMRQQTYQYNDFRMALGWFMFKFAGVGLPCGFMHEGGAVGYRSSLYIDTKDKLGVVVLSNVSTYHPKTGNISVLGYELLKKIYITQKISQTESKDAPFIEIALNKGWGTRIMTVFLKSMIY